MGNVTWTKTGWATGAAVALAGALFLGPLASEAHALQCGNSIALVGDSMAAVRARCGEPTTAETHYETVTDWIVLPSPGVAGRSRTITVEIIVWTYDFGPGRFIEQLVFRNGVLVSMGPVGPSVRPRPR